MKNNFIQRTITGLLFVATLVGCIIGGAIPFTVLFALISGLSIYEFGSIVNKYGDVHMSTRISALGGIVLFLCFGYICVAPENHKVFTVYLLFPLYICIKELYLKQKQFLHQHFQLYL